MDIVLTTIFPPSPGAKQIAHELGVRGGRLWVIGDRPGPESYPLPHTHFYDFASQGNLPFRLAGSLPERHYARKNLGYLLAIQNGAQLVVEIDDDNIPLPDFWMARSPRLPARHVDQPGWFNVYTAFTERRIWPRGFPLEKIQEAFDRPSTIPAALTERECLIQQGLADQNPDVDAVYRLTGPLPVNFDRRPPLSLGAGCWSPFNSQNTAFFKPAFPLLYLPSACTFRMTDIWRSFVAQRCLWAMEAEVGFVAPTARQERNEHRLLRDFQDEIPGYLQNDRCRRLLAETRLRPGRAAAAVMENLLRCYETLIQARLMPGEERRRVEAWNSDLSSLG